MINIITLCIIIGGILLYCFGAWLSGTFRLTNPFYQEEKTTVRTIQVIRLAPNPDERSAAAS